MSARHSHHQEASMDSAAVKDKVVDIICQKLDVSKDKVTLETKFADDLGADSLDQAELVMEFEDEFDINIPDDAEGKIKTVGDTVKFIEEQLSKKV
jgi:acyl carrier protein